MMFRRAFCALCALFPPVPVLAQEAVTFGDWRVYCAPTAGCAMGTQTARGDRFALSEPPSNDDLMIFVPALPVRPGSTIDLALDGRRVATLDPEEGWWFVDDGIRIAPDIVRGELVQPMRRHGRLSIRYVTAGGDAREVILSLNGYADTRGYVDFD